MKAASFICLLALMASTMAVAADDPAAPSKPEPPVRLKKKAKPVQPPSKGDAAKEQEPKKGPASRPSASRPDDEETGEDKNPAAAPGAEAEKEVVKRIAKNMRASEDRLSQHDPGTATRQIQGDILKDLDALIKQSEQPPPQSQQSQQDRSPNKQNRNEQNQNPRQQRAEKQRRQGGRSQQQQQRAAAAPAGEIPGRGGVSKERMGKIADLYKDVWGHLPETMRMEMDQYSREQFMAKYSDLLKRYYSTIAEKGNKKNDR
jgi:hypothetical protein